MPRTGVPRGGHCRPKCPTRLPTGWHRQCWTLFQVQRGQTSFRQRVRRIRGETPLVWTRGWLLRPGAFPRGHYRPKEPRTGVPKKGHCRPTNVQQGYRRGWHRRFLIFFGRRQSGFLRFSANEGRRPEVRNHRFGFASCFRGLVFPDGDITCANSNTAFDSSLEYSTDKVVLFWQPPSFFRPWSPSSFAVDDVTNSCAEQYMMAEKTRLFHNHRAVELIMTSPSPSTRKRIGRSVRNFDSGAGDREKQNAVLFGTYAKFTQKPAIKNHLLSSDNKLLAEFSPLDPRWGIGLRADGPRANNPCQRRGKTCSERQVLPFAKLFATMRPGRRTRPPLVRSAPKLRMLKNQEISSVLRPGG